VHPRIGRIRETVEFGGYQIGDMTDRVCGAQCANDRAAQGARPTGYDDVAAGEINHGDSSSDQAWFSRSDFDSCRIAAGVRHSI
jgi:hypothetical protein